jgi:hypothetical protein
LLSTTHGESSWSDNRQSEVRRRFEAATYAEGFRSITASFGTGPAPSTEPGGGDPGGNIQETVLKAFLKIEHLRLLYD